MPDRVRSPAQFCLVMALALLTYICQGAWLTTVAVFLAETHPALPAPALASAEIGLSYLVSVLLAQWNAPRYFRLSSILIGGGLVVIYKFCWIGTLFLILGTGWIRPIFICLVRATRPARVTANMAFGLYSVLINVGWMVGGLTTDTVRFSVGWPWVYSSVAALMLICWILSHWLAPRVGDTQESKSVGPGLSIASVCGLLAAVVCFYLVSAQFQSVLPLLVENDTVPLHVAAGKIRLTAGSLAAAHGGLVLLLTLCLSIQRARISSISFLVGGVLLMALSLAVLALVSYPLGSWWVLLTVLVVSVAESCIGPSMLALGSELAGLGRNAYWLAATIGNGASALLGVGWESWSHGAYFGTLAGFCILVGVVLLSTLGRRDAK